MDVNMHRDIEIGLDGQELAGSVPSENWLPFPEVSNGQVIGTHYLKIDTLRRTVLSDMCRQFRLPHSGTKQVLTARLEAFSSSPDIWNSGGHARRSHLGPQSGKISKTSAGKKSTQRRIEMLEQPAQVTTRTLPCILSTTVPEQRWNQAQHVADIEWAIRIMNLYPYRKEEARLALAAQTARLGGGVQSSRGSSIECDRELLKVGIDAANNKISKILEYYTTSGPPSALSSISEPSSPASNSSAQPLLNSQQDPGPAKPLLGFEAISMVSKVETVPAPTRTIALLNGYKLCFAADDVPQPPVISFANDIAFLNRMWDYSSEYWSGSSALVIKGVPIPIIYWKDVYTSKLGVQWKPKQWGSLKGKWFNWKILVKQWREGSPEQFWAKFTDPESGKRMGYQAILNRLKEQRTAKNAAIAERIKEEYGNQFTSAFSYMKKGGRHIMSTPCNIIKQYYKLKGLQLDDDDLMDCEAEE